MWAYIPMELGNRRERELKREVWKDMLGDGCRIERFEDTYESAWHIVDSLAQKDRALVQLSREIVDSQLRLNETHAGVALNRELEKLIRDRRDAARKIQEQARNQNNELVVQELHARQAEIEANIRHTADQLQKMRIPFTRKIRLFFKGKSN
jgi:chromosome condensin MukBEF ATPase and DNA-binding subunit MukB